MADQFVYPKHTFQDVENKFENYIHNPDDINRIKSAFAFAEKAHAGQFRKSGEPYIIHIIEVAYILTELNSGPNTLIAGILHDTIEDCGVTINQIAETFSLEIATLVDALTKIKALSHRNDKDFLAESHRKIFIAMARDVRVIVIKLADRLHNMRTLQYQPVEKQLRIARETIEVYAPIAHRLGINNIKTELENIALYYLERDKYLEIGALLNNNTLNRKKNIVTMQKKIADMLIDKGLKFEISARIKSIYSIYKKIYVKGRKFEEIYDIMALRIITETEVNCYEVLGYIHSIYKPIPGRFKDYIAMPKPNLYQSLHTTIVANDGNIYEIQIRTKEMDAIAENGIAAHWRYKENEKYDQKKEQREIEEKLHWLSDFKAIENINSDAHEYMQALQKDIFDANVYVFTPLGKVIDLPSGATPLDFAYKIHTKVGDSAVGAIVNGVLVPLSTVLNTGDVCEIKTSKNSNGPNEGWLNIVKTSFAKNHIRKFLAKRNEAVYREELIEKGHDLLVDELKEYGYSEKQMIKILSDAKVLKRYTSSSIEDLYALVGSKNLLPANIIDFLGLKKFSDEDALNNYIEKNTIKGHKSLSKQSILVDGANNVKINVSPCCSPLPGDKIIGYVSRGQGIKVHRIECPNIKEEPRLIKVFWNPNAEEALYPVNIMISSNDRMNLLIDVMNLLSQDKVPCQKISAKMHKESALAIISATILLPNVIRMNDVFNHILNIEGVFDVKRITK